MARIKQTANAPPCRYGANCYQTNPQHRAAYRHPQPAPATTSSPGPLPPCQYGAQCYRQSNPVHSAEYSHPGGAPTNQPAAARPQFTEHLKKVPSFMDPINQSSGDGVAVFAGRHSLTLQPLFVKIYADPVRGGSEMEALKQLQKTWVVPKSRFETVKAGSPKTAMLAMVLDGVGVSLRELSTGITSWTEALALKAVMGIVKGLHSIHAENWTHGQVSPDTVCWSDKRIRFIDLSLATPLGDRSNGLPKALAVGGSGGKMQDFFAPETRKPSPVASVEADVYSAGKVIEWLANSIRIPSPLKSFLLAQVVPTMTKEKPSERARLSDIEAVLSARDTQIPGKLSLTEQAMKRIVDQVNRDPAGHMSKLEDDRGSVVFANIFEKLHYLAAIYLVENEYTSGEVESIDSLLEFYENREQHYRSLFALNRDDETIEDPHLMLNDVFGTSLEYTKKPLTAKEKSYFYCFADGLKKVPNGKRLAVKTFNHFNNNFDRITNGMFRYVDWAHVFVAGGSVLAALQDGLDINESTYFNSDIDVFFTGLALEEVESKIIDFYQSVRRAVTEDAASGKGGGNLLLVRNTRSLTVIGEYPARQIQIVFRLFSSPAEGKEPAVKNEGTDNEEEQTSTKKRATKGKGNKPQMQEDEMPPAKRQRKSVENDDEEDEVENSLESIDGIKPKFLIVDGGTKDVKSDSSSSVYKIKRVMDHYYCTCMGWRMNKDPVNARTCKHLKELLGEQYEEARLRWKNPDGFKPSSPKKKAAKAGKKKKAKGEDEDEEDEDDNEDAGPSLKKQGAPKLLLANSFEMVNDPTGWWMSEKLDGVRAYWDPTLKAFLSRNGNPFVAPATFIQGYPTDMALDGELFSGRGEFTTTVSVVRTVNSPHWSKVRYKVFDAPDLKTPFEARVKTLQNWLLKSKACTTVDLVEQTKVTSRDHVVRELKRVESLGGEGLMLRKPGSMYEGRRSSTLLKVKSFYDAEARVTGYEKGKGKNEGVTGSLVCVMESGKTFKVGTGLTDAQRRNPPKVGAIITYRFQELTPDGVPRFPSYVGERPDVDKPKDAIVIKN